MEKSAGEKKAVIRVTANSSYGYQPQFIFCSYPYHRVFFSCRFLHFRAIKLRKNLYHFSLKFSNTLNIRRNTKEYCIIITKSTIVKLIRNIARHFGIFVTAVTDTTFTPVSDIISMISCFIIKFLSLARL